LPVRFSNDRSQKEQTICREDQDLGPDLQEENEDPRRKEKEEDTDAVVPGPPEGNLGHLTEPGNTDQGRQGTKEDLKGLPQDEADMMKIMGFGNFDSSKGKKVKGNDIYVANIPKKRRYRQYMNRRGGFNRPLDFIA
uniref:U4/U6.U5 small nuclear ribonucleoprotein 27 kDa protein n=1 Tax=Magallana gigas TaxID=29159 RepID=A0A8W8ISX5_MAGGI